MSASVASALAGPTMVMMSSIAMLTGDAIVNAPVVPAAEKRIVPTLDPFFLIVNVVSAVAAVPALALLPLVGSVAAIAA